MPIDNPVVMCTKHAVPFHKVSEEMDEDGTQVMVKQYWAAACECQSRNHIWPFPTNRLN